MRDGRFFGIHLRIFLIVLKLWFRFRNSNNVCVFCRGTVDKIMINIAICDDENKILADISKKAQSILSDASISTYSEGKRLLNDMMDKSFDVILLDIDMPETDGLAVAELILKMASKPLIIFVTSHDELVYDSLMLHPFGFVRKAYVERELKKVLEDAADEISSRDKHFFFHTSEGDIRLKMDDILYFEASGNYVNVYTALQEYKFRETLQTLENSLGSDGFVRVHKGFLVNSENVQIIRSDCVVLVNDISIPFGRSFCDAARKRLMRSMIH